MTEDNSNSAKGKIVLRRRGGNLYRYRKYYDHARKQWRYAYLGKVGDSSGSLPSEDAVKSVRTEFAAASPRFSFRFPPVLRTLQHSKTLRNIQSRPALLSLIVTAVMVLSLIYVPTAGAVSVQATLQPGQNLVQGDQPLVFNVIITVDSGERLPVQRLDIVLDTLTYQFNPEGSPLNVPDSAVTVLSLTPQPRSFLIRSPDTDMATDPSAGMDSDHPPATDTAQVVLDTGPGPRPRDTGLVPPPSFTKFE